MIRPLFTTNNYYQLLYYTSNLIFLTPGLPRYGFDCMYKVLSKYEIAINKNEILFVKMKQYRINYAIISISFLRRACKKYYHVTFSRYHNSYKLLTNTTSGELSIFCDKNTI